MTKKNRPTARLGALLLVALLAPPVRSQPPAPTPQPAAAPSTGFREVVDVNVVNLTVRVTGKDGRPVKDLDRADFEIFEDGKPVEIANFYEVSSSTDYAQVARAREAR